MLNDRYLELFERSADAILIIEDGKFVECNESAIKMLCYKNKSELLNSHPFDLSPEYQSDGCLSSVKSQEMIALAFKQGSHRFDWEHLRADGKVLNVEVLLTAIKKGERDTLHVVWRDISYLKKVEKWQEEQIELLSVGADVGKFLTEENDLDEMLQKCCNLFVEHLDAAFCRVWILNQKEKMLQLQASAGMYTHLDGAHSRISVGAYKIGRIAENKKAHLTNNVIGDPQVHNQDWAKKEGMVAFAGFPLIIDDNVVGVLAMFFRHKISEIVSKSLASVSDQIALGILRKQTDKKLQRNIQYLSSIIENIPDCVQLIDPDGRVLEMNPAGFAMFGTSSKSNVVGTSIYDFIADEDRLAFQNFNEDVCGGQRGKLNFTINDLEGNKRIMKSVAVPLYYSPQDAVVHLGIVQDVTNEIAAEAEKAKLQGQLNQAQKMESLGTLAGGIAHDFNNILTAIYGYAELAKGDVDKPEVLLNDLDEVLHGADRARELVKQILAFSRKTDHELQPLRIQSIVKEVLKLLRSTLPSTIEIKQEISSDCDPILADATQIHQVIMNLCTNAYHAMKKTRNGCLTVSLKPVKLKHEKVLLSTIIPPGNYVRLNVADTGSGISGELLERIFEPYYTTKAQGEGTGLGLAVVHGIVESLNGKITVASDSGSGTIFSVYLPVIQQRIACDLQTDDVGTAPGGTERILFVDDDQVIVALQQKNLENLGYSVTGCADSLMALQLFKERPDDFDLLITDMTMPGMTGEELSREVLAIRPEMPILLCTGYSERINAEKAKKIGICEFAEKPLSRRGLAELIRHALAATPETQVKT